MLTCYQTNSLPTTEKSAYGYVGQGPGLRNWTLLLRWLMCFTLFWNNNTHICAAVSPWLGPTAVAVSPDGKMLYLACERARQIAVVNLETRKTVRFFRLDESPTGLILMEKPSRLIITCAGKSNQTICLDGSSGLSLAAWPGGNGTCAPIVSRTDSTLFVCNRYDNTVSFIDMVSGRELKRKAVSREPVSASLSTDGETLAIANLLPDGPVDKTVVHATVTLLDTREDGMTQIDLANGSTSVRAVAFHPKENVCAVIHNIARFQVPATQVENGWMNVSALSLLSTDDSTLVATVLLDEPRRGAANPYSLAWTPEGSHLCITHAGTHELSVIDFPGLVSRLDHEKKGSLVGDLSFLDGIRHRVRLRGNGPRSVALSHGRAYVTEFFSDSITAVDLGNSSVLYTIQLTEAGSETQEREGEKLFNDATLCHQGWQSCATCHPDGRADGLNWDLLNDGIGNPKNTKSLLLAHRTPPAMSLGERKTAEVAVRSGLRHILFSSQPESVAAAMDAYLESIKPVSSPLLAAGKLSPGARRGQRLFRSQGCVNCHPPPLFTDLKQHNVGTSGRFDKGTERFDTPTLIEAWRTAPYLHDGSVRNILEVLRTRNLSQKHGNTAALSESALEDLCLYVLSL
jgi:DNA-binding beta-propeller fold protein YncE